MFMSRLSEHKKALNIVALLFMCILLLQSAGCIQTSGRSLSKEQEARKKILFNKLDTREKLTGLDIDRLVVILSLEGQYDDAFAILQKLRDSALYAKEEYIISFGLSILYLAKAHDEKELRSRLLEKAEENLQKGFQSSPEKPLAYFKRAQVYATFGCIEKAKKDITEAIQVTPYQEIITFDHGLYASRERFLDLLNDRLEALNTSENNCLIED